MSGFRVPEPITTKGTGLISATELKNVLQNLSEFKTEEIDDMIEYADSEKSGQIYYQKFVKKLNSH